MLLAVDTSTQWIGLALYDGAQVLGEMVWRSAGRHTVELAPSLDGLFQHTGAQPGDLEALGIATGPGSFTGLRIGLALVKGLALALRLPVAGIPTLDILAAAQPLQDLPLVAVLEVGRGRVAAGRYAVQRGRWTAQKEPQLTTVEELAKQLHTPTIVCGELNEDSRQLLGRRRKNVLLASPAQSLRRPAYLAEMAWKRFKDGRMDEVASLSPLYLRTAQPIPE